jgi:hypothetical protein
VNGKVNINYDRGECPRVVILSLDWREVSVSQSQSHALERRMWTAEKWSESDCGDKCYYYYRASNPIVNDKKYAIRSTTTERCIGCTDVFKIVFLICRISSWSTRGRRKWIVTRTVYVNVQPSYFCVSKLNEYRRKGKAIPLQALTGLEGSRRLRLPDFKTIGTWRW